MHLQASISLEDLNLFNTAKQSGGVWKGDLEKTALFDYWMSFFNTNIKSRNSEDLAVQLPPFPNTVAPKKRDTIHIHAITSEESVRNV